MTVALVEKKQNELYTSHGLNVLNVLPVPGKVLRW
jgi:hypothetical protein